MTSSRSPLPMLRPIRTEQVKVALHSEDDSIQRSLSPSPSLPRPHSDLDIP
jgi:hypothetical protein